MSKHLEIKQTALQENVSSAVIDKLYHLTYEDSTLGIDPVVDSQRGDIVGNIVSPAAFEDAVEFLRSKFGPDVENNIEGLNIDVINNNYYLRLKDPVIENILVSTYGDGIGVTRAQLAAVTDSVYYNDNTGRKFDTRYNLEFLNAESYDDLQYFTKLTSGNYFILIDDNAPDSYFTETASYQSNVKIMHKKSFIAPATTLSLTNNNIYLIRGRSWAKKIQFDYIDISKLNVIPSNPNIWTTIFCYVDIPFENVKFPEYTVQNCAFFTSNGLLGKFIYPEGVVEVHDNFRGCNVNYIDYPESLEKINAFESFRRDGSTGGYIVFRSINPPEIISETSLSYPSYYFRFPPTFCCPSESLSAYKAWLKTVTFSDTNSTTGTNYTLYDLVTSFITIESDTFKNIERIYRPDKYEL